MSLWINRIFFVLSAQLAEQNQIRQAQEEVQKQILPQAPRGLFGYGGMPFHASLVANGLNREIEQIYPDYKLRFTKPSNNDFSSTNSIKMLTEGELSLAYTGRPLQDQEIERSNLRGEGLKQVPVAIDGIVFFGNLPVSVKLNLDQVQGILQGKITNWRQIDSDAQNIPIVPFLLRSEELGMLNLEKISTTVESFDNYTQLLRKVIGTPGAFSFSSASLVNEQELVKIFSLGDNNLSSYVPAFINGSPNLKAFRDGTYPLTRKLFVVYREDNTVEQEAAEAYIRFVESKKGQEIINNSGFVPLR